MFVKIYSYRFAQEILSNSVFDGAYQEILDICEECPLPYHYRKSTDKSKYVVQQLMNTYFKLRFEALGWTGEPDATNDTQLDKLRADFRKTFLFGDTCLKCQIEVEFGNAASLYRDYFKFMTSYSQGMTDIAILIVPSNDIAKHISDGVANYEKAKRELPESKLSVTVPILVIGLFDEDDAGNKVEPWDLTEARYTLDVIKGTSRGPGKKGSRNPKKVGSMHNKLVQDYIDGHIKKK